MTASAVDLRARLVALNEAGSRALVEGRATQAIAHFEAAVRHLLPDDDDAAAALYENLGLAYVAAERALPAVRAFLRAFDGDPGARPQALRFIVTCLVNTYRFDDARHYLGLWERSQGTPHPDGWTAESLDQLRAGL